jgi:hypothetical protein
MLYWFQIQVYPPERFAEEDPTQNALEILILSLKPDPDYRLSNYGVRLENRDN